TYSHSVKTSGSRVLRLGRSTKSKASRRSIMMLYAIGLVLDRLRFPCRIIHQRRDLDHVAVRYLRFMRLLRLAPAAIEQSFGGGYAGGVRRTGFSHDGSERLDGLFGVHSCQRGDFERSFSHLTAPRLPATASGLQPSIQYARQFDRRRLAIR